MTDTKNTTNHETEDQDTDNVETFPSAAESYDPIEDLIEDTIDTSSLSVDPDLKERVVALETELADMKDKALRALAEAENTRRRAEIDKSDAAKFGVSNFAKALLSVSDNLRRAIEAIPEDLVSENEAVKNLMTGIEATERELLRAFETQKIEKLNPMGEKFDPNLHEVLFEMDAAGQEPGTVLQVVEVGYKIHDRLLRPARVGVAKATTETSHSVDEMA